MQRVGGVNGNKIITGSSGGMFLTNSKEDADKVRKWSTQSREAAPWYQHEEIGYNYRMESRLMVMHLLKNSTNTSYATWMGEEVHNIAVSYKLKPVIAHIHRYLGYYSKGIMEQVLATKAIFQVNNEAFGNFRERRFVKKLIKEGYPVIFGSDSHNLDDRKPNWDLLKKKVKEPVIKEAMELLQKHFRKE